MNPKRKKTSSLLGIIYYGIEIYFDLFSLCFSKSQKLLVN